MLVVAATPIGNLGDHTPRLVELLESADLIVAEDTRQTRALINKLGLSVSADIRPLHEHNETEVIDSVLASAARGLVVLVSDAGMPGISDPGYPLVAEAHRRGITVSVAPGPNAVIAALAASGLPTDRFCFEGFIPKKARQAWLADLAGERRTMVFFESPHRLHSTLGDMAQVFGSEREATVCRELTKKFEQISRGTLAELAEQFSGDVKGEVTLVVRGSVGPVVNFDQALERVASRIAQGHKATEATREVARETGHSKPELYRAWLERGA